MSHLSTKIMGAGACVAALAGLAFPAPASACGGCFAPNPTGAPTVVTRHEMAVAISMDETTLWDQIEYAGDAEDFVWVLPVRDGAPVELAENAFFEALEQATTITLQAPAPPLTTCPDPCGGGVFAGAAFDGERGGPMSTVEVHHQAAIGPYETATIGSEDPMALILWLRDNGYNVPDEMLPIIRHYTDQGMDFAVLRLSANFGVNQMQPVRVTMPGLNPVFPLRMVAAGVSGSVGLELFVLSEGRYEPMNFASTEVDRGALVYDWDTSLFNYDALYDEAASADGGRAWVSEFAGHADEWSIQNYVSYDEDGNPHEAAGDWEVVARGLTSPYLTRMTADLTVDQLGEDLVLGAAAGGDLLNFVQVFGEVNRAPDIACSNVCTDPYGGGSAGGLRGASRGDGLTCSATPARGAGSFGLAVLFGSIFAFAARRRRSR